MSFKYRTKTYRDEDGEYSEYLPCDKDSILKIIETYWIDESMPNGLQVISIINDFGQSLLLEHFGKDVFDVYFLPKEKGQHFHKKSKQSIIYDCTDLFMTGKIIDLTAYLNKTKKDDKYIREEFFFIDHDYRLTKERSLKELYWIFWAGIPYGLTFTFVALGILIKAPTFLFVFGLVILALGTYSWLPGLLLHLQYQNDGENLTVRLTRGSKSIMIKHSSGTKIIDKTDIISVTKFENPVYKNPWSEYGFTEIKFKSGDIVNFTNLMVDQFSILDKFKYDNVESKTVNKAVPRLKNKSSIQ